MKEKGFFFRFCARLFVTFSLGEGRLHLGNTKKNKFSFGISLDLHYLCPQNMMVMNAFRIDGQRAVVTGGGSGLGLGIAKVFVEAGAEVIIIGRNEEKLQAAQKQLGARCSYRAFDVTKLNDIPALVKDIGAVDILVNCAGTHLKKWALDVHQHTHLRLRH